MGGPGSGRRKGGVSRFKSTGTSAPIVRVPGKVSTGKIVGGKISRNTLVKSTNTRGGKVTARSVTRKTNTGYFAKNPKK